MLVEILGIGSSAGIKLGAVRIHPKEAARLSFVDDF